MARASLFGLTDHLTRDPLLITKLKAQVFTLGLTVANLMASGFKIRCTVVVFLLGQMADVMKAIILMIGRKVTESLLGLMVESTQASGKMESSMEKGNTLQTKVKSNRVSGEMVSV